MGLFGKLFDKKECDICGGEIGLLGNRKLEDGNCCKECARKLSYWFDERRHSTVEQIKEQLDYREKNRQAVTAFNTTRVFGEDWELRIDERQGKFMIVRTNDIAEENPDVVDLSQITACELDVDENRYEEKRKDEDGNEVSYNPPRYRYTYNFDIIIRVNHPYFDDMKFRLNSRTVEVFPPTSRGGFFNMTTESPGTRSYEYQQYRDMGMEIKDILMNTRKQMFTEAAAASESIMDPGFQEEAPVSAVWTCPYCQAANEGGKFCQNCGAPRA